MAEGSFACKKRISTPLSCKMCIRDSSRAPATPSSSTLRTRRATSLPTRTSAWSPSVSYTHLIIADENRLLTGADIPAEYQSDVLGRVHGDVYKRQTHEWVPPCIACQNGKLRCGYSPDLLAILQGNPGRTTPWYFSIKTCRKS